MKFIMLINVKMPTIVGILAFIRMINKLIESMKARKVFKTFFRLNSAEHEIYHAHKC